MVNVTFSKNSNYYITKPSHNNSQLLIVFSQFLLQNVFLYFVKSFMEVIVKKSVTTYSPFILNNIIYTQKFGCSV